MSRPGKEISERFYPHSQSLWYERVLDHKGTRFRVEIRRNAYDDQSWARVDRWNGEEWKRVVHAPISACLCKEVSYAARNPTQELFEKDADRLLQEALEIAGDPT
jgi:hypothetical protein